MQPETNELQLEELTEEEHVHLSQQLRLFRHPLSRAWRKARPLIEAAALAYMINAGIQLYRFATSEPVDVRLELYGTGLAITEQLAEDEAFLTVNRTYLAGKMYVDEQFRDNILEIDNLLDKKEATKKELRHNFERIYNPLKAFE
jgi:hypothetical protein